MKKIYVILASVFLVAACNEQDNLIEKQANQTNKKSKNLKVNGQNVEILSAEYLTSGETEEVGTTVFFKNVGNKQLGADFVAADPRRGGRTNIIYHIDNQITNDVPAMSAIGAIKNSMLTWDAQSCSDISITEVPVAGDAGFVQNFLGFGGIAIEDVDVQHNGWLPAAFFDAIRPNGSQSILGVTFTLIFVDANGNPTDIDNNNKTDVAFREIYYNDRFLWKTNGSSYDIETVSLHESGHALSQGHFGKAFRTLANGELHFAPRSVMNAAYSGVQRALASTDHAGHCSNWSSWPNK